MSAGFATNTFNFPDEGMPVYLTFPGVEGRTIDSARIESGVFRFKGVLSEPAVFAQLFLNVNPQKVKHVKKPDRANLVLQEGEIHVESADSIKNILVSGSRAHQEWLAFEQMRRGNDRQFAILNDCISSGDLKNSQIRDRLKQQEIRLMHKLNAIRIRFARQYPNSYVGLTMLFYAASDTLHTQDARKSFEKLSAWLKQTDLGQQTRASLTAARQTRIGEMAPLFEQPGVDGAMISLADFRGKYLLLDFWASWCGPCREENPNLVALFDRYKNKGFTILGVSLDMPGSRQKWLDAIKKDQLKWTQVADLKGWQNRAAAVYGVKAIPGNFLIDPQGKIIARDFPGEALKARLAALFD